MSSHGQSADDLLTSPSRLQKRSVASTGGGAGAALSTARLGFITFSGAVFVIYMLFMALYGSSGGVSTSHAAQAQQQQVQQHRHTRHHHRHQITLNEVAAEFRQLAEQSHADPNTKSGSLAIKGIAVAARVGADAAENVLQRVRGDKTYRTDFVSELVDDYEDDPTIMERAQVKVRARACDTHTLQLEKHDGMHAGTARCLGVHACMHATIWCDGAASRSIDRCQARMCRIPTVPTACTTWVCPGGTFAAEHAQTLHKVV